MPPIVPGSAAVAVVSITATMDGSLEDFTAAKQQIYKTSMATTLGVAPKDIALVITGGSVVVETQVKIPDTFGAAVEAFILSNIAATVVSAAQAAGSQVLSVSSPKRVVVVRASLPPSAPPSPPPPPPPTRAIIDDAAAALGATGAPPSSGLPISLAWGVALGILFAVATAIGIGIFFYFMWMKKAREQKKTPMVAIQSPAQESTTNEEAEQE